MAEAIEFHGHPFLVSLEEAEDHARTRITYQPEARSRVLSAVGESAEFGSHHTMTVPFPLQDTLGMLRAAKVISACDRLQSVFEAASEESE